MTTEAPTRPCARTTRSSSATTPASAPSATTCSRTSASRWSTCARPTSTAASCCTCRTTRRRARCAAATFPARRACRGRGRPNEDGTFKSRAELEALYGGEAGLAPADDVVVYCRIGERSSHTWFVLTHLLGYERVRNYDGSWTEWGNSVRVPIEREEEPAYVTIAVLPPPLGRDRRGCSPTSPPRDRLELLLEYSHAAPSPAATAARASRAARAGAGVPVAAVRHREVDDDDSSSASLSTRRREAPTTRGFAGILHAGLDGLPAGRRAGGSGRRHRAARPRRGRQPAPAARRDRPADPDPAPGAGEARRGLSRSSAVDVESRPWDAGAPGRSSGSAPGSHRSLAPAGRGCRRR